MNYNIFQKETTILEEFVFEIDRETRDNILKFCFTHVGVSYGMKQILGIAYSKLMKLLGKSVGNPFADGLNTMICSEVVGRILQFVKNDFHRQDLDNMGVKDIHDYLRGDFRG